VASSTITNISAERVYVIGDIHGCPDELEVLLRSLEVQQGLGQKDTTVFLGDFIDRGPNSKAVIDLLIDFKSKFPATVFLKGNHEDMLLDFLGYDGRLGQAFLYNGGVETIQSYGISVFSPPEEMRSALPPAHLAFYLNLLSIVRIDDFVCVHAGLNPLRELNAQNDADVFWIRDEFISNLHSFEVTVVFGHTPYREVLVHLPYKIGIDTGLVFGNKLSCLELRSGSVFQIARGAAEVTTGKIELKGSFGERR
jgi:serine/threonine protein phosphatase 1